MNASSHNPNHHVCVHGHFYQPPRENPWLGVIEPQESAAPFRDWNARINAECYAALTGSCVRDEAGRVRDLFNNFAHMSFNVGPTLLAWLEQHDPETYARILRADELARLTYDGCGSAMAQAYNHMIMPLSDARDRHTQIVWGLREFRHRFGRPAKGMWLPECAIDNNTVRALIAHGVRFVVLSPEQASKARPFGGEDWTDVYIEGLDTRMPYRVFEVDGAGRTHFDRWLDVVFYDQGLSLKVSFNHLLQDVDSLEWHVRERFDDAALPQLVAVATDGEAYGHHEPFGNDTLAEFFSRMLADRHILLTNIELYLRQYPPCWEVKLWNGEQGKGSSWSCKHGVGRWERDCGCNAGGGHDWNQQWRGPLRDAFDLLRDQVREIFRREGGRLFDDVFEARNDYIRVRLDPSERTRAAFLARHAQHTLSADEEALAWTLLEADRNAMLMYTSCGWFFSELSGIEPVQNMRYALRAAELAQPYADVDLIDLLRGALSQAESNIPGQGTGAEIFDRHVLSTRYDMRTVVACHALRRLLDLPAPAYRCRVTISGESRTAGGEARRSFGTARAEDPDTRLVEDCEFIAFEVPGGPVGVLFAPPGDDAWVSNRLCLSPKALGKFLDTEGVTARALPFEDRRLIMETLLQRNREEAVDDVLDVYERFRLLLKTYAEYELPLPSTLGPVGSQALAARFGRVVSDIAARNAVTEEHFIAARALREEAVCCHLDFDKAPSARCLGETLDNALCRLQEELTLEHAEAALELLAYARETGLELTNRSTLTASFWQVLHLPPRELGGATALLNRLRELGRRLDFAEEPLQHLTRVLFRTDA